MSKRSGLGNQLYVGGYDISGDVGALSNLSTPKGEQNVTGIDKSATERIQLLVDGDLSFDTFFNDATGKIHDALSTLPTTDRQGMFLVSTTRGEPAFAMNAKQINYDWTRGAEGSLSGTTQLLQADGNAPAWGESIAMKETISSAGDITGYIDAAQTTAGVVAYLQIFTLASGTPTITLQDSSDTTDGDNGSWETIGTFTINSARSAERLVVAGTIEKALRIEASGTFSNLVVAAMVRRGTAEDN
tara:strand:+ start:1203 stop:1937 length:735 start_codon:yes stop_codon:yes gene_type:complete